MKRKALLVCFVALLLQQPAFSQEDKGLLTYNLADTFRDKRDLLHENAFFKREADLGYKLMVRYQIIAGVELLVIAGLTVALVRKKRKTFS